MRQKRWVYQKTTSHRSTSDNLVGWLGKDEPYVGVGESLSPVLARLKQIDDELRSKLEGMEPYAGT